MLHGNLRIPPLCHPHQEIRPYFLGGGWHRGGTLRFPWIEARNSILAFHLSKKNKCTSSAPLFTDVSINKPFNETGSVWNRICTDATDSWKSNNWPKLKGTASFIGTCCFPTINWVVFMSQEGCKNSSKLNANVHMILSKSPERKFFPWGPARFTCLQDVKPWAPQRSDRKIVAKNRLITPAGEFQRWQIRPFFEQTKKPWRRNF